MSIPRADHPAAPAAKAAKAALRAGLRAARRSLGGQERAALEAGLVAAALGAQALAALPEGAAVALYDSRPTEPGPRSLRAALAARGLVVVLPVVVGAQAPLAWVVDRGGDDGGGDDGGGPHRNARAWPGGLGAVDVVLLPAFAVDRSRTRLGQGGGHYDRTLALLPAATGPLLAAVVREEELLPAGSLPREAHDVVVDAALTPSGWHDLR